MVDLLSPSLQGDISLPHALFCTYLLRYLSFSIFFSTPHNTIISGINKGFSRPFNSIGFCLVNTSLLRRITRGGRGETSPALFQKSKTKALSFEKMP